MKLSLLPFAAITMALLMPSTHAFTFNALNIPSKELTRFREPDVVKKPADTGFLLDVTLQVGQDQQHMMSLNDMRIELLPDNIAKKSLKNYPSLPGAQGPNPNSSTGAKHLNIVESPFFIGMSGKQPIDFTSASWEIVWRDNSDSGRLICGFEVPTTYKRNDATLPKGRLYMSFPVWTKETLANSQLLKADAELRGNKLLEEKAEAMRKYEVEPNVFKKFLHYKDALSAAERFSLIASYNDVPSSDKDSMVLQDDLVMNTQGTVWTKKDAGFFANPHEKSLLGTATLSPVVLVDEEEEEEATPSIKNELRP